MNKAGWMTVVLLALGFGAAGFFWGQSRPKDVPVTPPGEAASAATPPDAKPDTAGEAPVDPDEKQAQAASQEPLPKIDGSLSIEQLINQLTLHDKLEALFNIDDLVRRFVVTVDNATTNHLMGDFSIAKPLNDEFRVDQDADTLVLSQKNFERYTPYVELFNAVDAKQLVAIYASHYSKFQDAYLDLGEKGSFNQRLIAVIDDTINAPVPRGSLKLEKQGYYEFADPDLEGLSAAQKILVRMGPSNEQAAKKRLKYFRALLAHLTLK